MLDLAFDTFALHRVVGRIEPRNVASARVLERLGMRREGLLVENELVEGEWQTRRSTPCWEPIGETDTPGCTRTGRPSPTDS